MTHEPHGIDVLYERVGNLIARVDAAAESARAETTANRVEIVGVSQQLVAMRLESQQERDRISRLVADVAQLQLVRDVKVPQLEELHYDFRQHADKHSQLTEISELRELLTDHLETHEQIAALRHNLDAHLKGHDERLASRAGRQSAYRQIATFVALVWTALTGGATFLLGLYYFARSL